ncbi:bifunctional ADP-dependent NAD(P)H-hydrate dehydratase/NAD(P)H-hydrate epimerase [Erythrobacter sp. KY5]|uniref:NAD(P)H-hydrate dehydratase n=1 Tax=Erythrobacter sp. KY5 TaxID=2011159 RepID=UPI000DBEF84D|nr:NAD(P)H-hydrate dehydratase [Erythrobacter sp. KY5]AWW74909.1 bifunctional ADP-dependent NAD(P)H-hydrate dehydratase/NAD(P)H-hydrate epimerase [Erythrobacter sp. KY5]
MNSSQILTASQMQAAEQRIFDRGTSVFELMQLAAGGAAEWIRRLAGGRSVTVLCGPGNNGGDGYVIAHRLREFGNEVTVIAPLEPKTDAAQEARNLWGGAVLTSGNRQGADILVDCLFGSGLSRPLSGEHALLLRDLADRHATRIAIDVPSGIASDTGALLNDKLPEFDVTLALGAWKFAHWLLPGRAKMGTKRLVPIGVEDVEGAAHAVSKPRLAPPSLDAHKYRRGFAAVVGGSMPGAAVLASEAAMRSGAGYVKLFADQATGRTDPGLVIDTSPLAEALGDRRLDGILIGPGLGRDDGAEERLSYALSMKKPTVLDADALMLLRPDMLPDDPVALATPHDGELEKLCRAFSVVAESRRDRALALARGSGMVVLAKGPDSAIAAPDGRVCLVPPAPSWLSIAGTGDVLAGIAVSRLASGAEPFDAACEAAWLHSRAAQRCGAAFTAMELAHAVSGALAECL